MADRPTVEERFKTFLKEHPEVYREFRRIAREHLKKRAAGRIKSLSAKTIMEYVRGQGLKVSNDFTRFYARKLVAEYPEFEGALYIKTKEEEPCSQQ